MVEFKLSEQRSNMVIFPSRVRSSYCMNETGYLLDLQQKLKVTTGAVFSVEESLPGLRRRAELEQTVWHDNWFA
jgi:hypothetical protein